MSEKAKQDESVDNRGIKRKKKRSATQMAKKYVRQSERRNNGELDTDTYQYMLRILDSLRQDFDTLEEKLMFVDNVYKETIGHEVEYARNQVGSRVLESLTKYASYEVIQRLADAFGPSLRPMCSDRFASHVLQEIIRVCADRGNQKPAEETTSKSKKDSYAVGPNDAQKYNNVALKLCKYVINNFEEFIWDTYANHVLRTVIKCLGGAIDTEKDGNKNKTASSFENKRPVVQEYTELLIDACNRILKWPQFLELGKDEITSGLLQTMLQSLQGTDSKLNAEVIKRITEECFTENTDQQLSTIFHTESSVRLLEVCLAVAKPKMYTKMYKRLFIGRLGELSLMSGANFTVQRLLDHCVSKEEMEEIFDELSTHFVAILERKNTGIFVSLANACLRLQCKQGPFVNVITEALGCDKSAEAQLQIVPVISSLQKYEQVLESSKGGHKIPVHLHGSMILQAMLRFNKPIKIVNSLLATSAEDLVYLLSDPKGSRILDAFMESKFIGEKSREKLAKKLQGNLVDLACGVHGSRCLDRIWQWSKTNQRHFIMDELASVGEALCSTKTGKLISAKLNVPLYARNKKDWANAQDKQDKTKDLFADILNTGASVKKTSSES